MEKSSWIFGVVGNIVSTHGDENGNIYYGTKAFTPGTKVYLYRTYQDNEQKIIKVIGRNRFGKTVHENISVDLIENIRTQRIYKPKVLDLIDYLTKFEGYVWWGKTAADRRGTEQFVKEIKDKKRGESYENNNS